MVISNLNFPEMGGGAFWSEIPERGFLENLDKNLLFSQKPACASQIVSHILRMWRLKSSDINFPTGLITTKEWYLPKCSNGATVTAISQTTAVVSDPILCNCDSDVAVPDSQHE